MKMLHLKEYVLLNKWEIHIPIITGQAFLGNFNMQNNHISYVFLLLKK